MCVDLVLSVFFVPFVHHLLTFWARREVLYIMHPCVLVGSFCGGKYVIRGINNHVITILISALKKNSSVFP